MLNKEGKRVTLSTIKAFIKREMARGNLYISNKSDFDGMVDCVMPCDNKGFRKATAPNCVSENNQGVNGAWFVRSSRDYFQPFADENFIGYEVSNCCGDFILAMHR